MRLEPFGGTAQVMKAARIYEYGGPEVFRIEEIPEPAVGPKDVLVRVHAASVNPVDTKTRQGMQRAIMFQKFPAVLGLDVSGVVTQVGDQVTQFRVGDEVFSSPTHRRQGTYAEVVAMDESEVALKPKNLTHAEAASIPLVGLTGLQLFEARGGVKPGQRVFVQAGAGGVGSFAVQFAKHCGATVATTCSARNVELVRELGADVVVDYAKERYEDVLEPQDWVLDTLGGEHRKRGAGLLRRGGHFAAIQGGFPERVDKFGPYLGVLLAVLSMLWFQLTLRLVRGVRAHWVLRKPSGSDLARIAKLVEAGSIRPLIDSSFTLDEISDAHRKSESGRARGKIVVDVIGDGQATD